MIDYVPKNLSLRGRVKTGSAFVKDQDAWLLQERSCNRQALALASGQLAAIRSNVLMEPLWQCFDELDKIS